MRRRHEVLVSADEQLKRLSAARFQLDVMGVPGIIVARTDAESATLLDGRSDERDQPFILGAISLHVPAFRAAFLAMLRRFHRAGVRGGLRVPASRHGRHRVRGRRRLARAHRSRRPHRRYGGDAREGRDRSRRRRRCLREGIQPLRRRLAGRQDLRRGRRRRHDLPRDRGRGVPDDPRRVARLRRPGVLLRGAREGRGDGHPCAMGLRARQDPRRLLPGPRRRRLRHRQVAGRRAVRRPPLDGDQDRRSPRGEAVRRRHPRPVARQDAGLQPVAVVQLGHDGHARRGHAPIPGGARQAKLGYVFNFVTYGGHQIDGLASEEFASALRQDGMLALARLQRKLRLLESPYQTPQTLVGGPRADAALMAISGRTSTTKAMGKGSTQFQHLVQTEVPPKLLEEWLDLWRKHHDYPAKLKVLLKPHTVGSDLLELAVRSAAGDKVLNMSFAIIQDRRGRSILSVRDQNTFDVGLRKKRLMLLAHLFLIHRYRVESVHYLTPTDDNQRLAEKMKARDIFSAVNNEVGEIIVADVNAARIKELLVPDRAALETLIAKG